MYFPNAFRKSYLPAISSGAVSVLTDTSKTTADLTAGQVGFFNPTTWAAIATGANVPFVLAQGSYVTTDFIGPFSGGHKESVKSKTINPKYVNRLIKITSRTAKNQIIMVNAAGCAIACNTTYRLRLDLKGSAALRFMSHNMYTTLDAFSGCCNSTNDNVDPIVLLLQWMDQVNGHPTFSKFVQAVVWNLAATTTTASAVTNSATMTVASGSGIAVGQKVSATGISGTQVTVSAISGTTVTLSSAVSVASGATVKFYTSVTTAGYTPVTGSGVSAVDAHMSLIAAYVDTKFGYCTFTPTDKYDLEPLFIYASFVEDSGDACAVVCFTTTETQTPVQASGIGESVLRDLIMSGRYMREEFPDSSSVDSLRMREIEANPVLATIDRSALYDQIMILHSVPRFNNPTGVFDNEQYLLVLHVPTGTTTTAITNFVAAACSAAGNNVTLETF